VDEGRIRAAEESLAGMLDTGSLSGRTFLDVGAGSGLFSLAAVRLGALRVHSFDFDAGSVACAEELRRCFAPEAPWHIERGSVLDDGYRSRLGQWDIVYSWGVLHHTGDLWGALDGAAGLVAPGGLLFIAVYNDQGLRSKLWTIEKRLYVRHAWLRPVLIASGLTSFVIGAAATDVARGVPPWRRYRRHPVRGMALVPDLVDWLGGYPFEVATRDQIRSFFEARGFFPVKQVSCGRSSGCNEFIFRAAHHARTPAGDA
jgi:2-polyprenyl-6-hydroxyphenyl methylase/3-demethylubiquinone-9 3-methyltransferase